jgi:hypothetical protein
MKDYSWLAVFSVFTIVVGGLFTYGSGAHALPQTQPIQVYVVSTSSPAAPVIIRNSETQPISVTLPEITIAPPEITVNITIATSSFVGREQGVATPSTTNVDGATYTYYVTNNSYTTTENIAQDDSSTTTPTVANSITLTIQGVYQSTTTEITSGQTLLAFLTHLNDIDPSLALGTQDYGDMGVLVTTMGGLVNGTDGKYWQYTVNEIAPLIGADQYVLQATDAVVWEFKGF